MASNDAILRRNQKITEIIKRLQAPDEKRTTDIERDIADAYIMLTDVNSVNKNQILNSALHPRVRASYAIELLLFAIKKPWYGKREIKDDDKVEEKKASEEAKQKPENKEGTVPPSTNTQSQSQQPIQTPGASSTGSPNQSMANASSASGTLLPQDTQRFPQTSDTMSLTPSTGDTQKLQTKNFKKDTIPLPETDMQPYTGDTIVGKEIYGPEDNQYVILQKAPSAPYAAALSPSYEKGPKLSKDALENSSIKYTQEVIDARAKKLFERAKNGEFGDEVARKATQDPEKLRSQIFEATEEREWAKFVEKQPEIAIHYQGSFTPITRAIDQRIEIDKYLERQGLLDMNNPIERDEAFRGYIDIQQTERVFNNFSEIQRPTTEKLFDAAVKERVQILNEFSQIPNVNSKNLYVDARKKISSSLSQITKKLGLDVEKSVTTNIATSTVAKVSMGNLVKSGLIKFLGGMATGGIGWIVSLLPSIIKFIKRKAPTLAQLGTAILGLSFLTGNAFTGGIGAGLLGLSFAGGGPGAILSGIRGFGAALAAFLMTFVLTAIVVQIIISFVIAIAIVAIILFILNVNGYITPESDPLSQTREATTFYINLQKTASPVRIRNEDASTRPITFTVRIDARELDLTNIAFENTYLIYQEPRTADPIASGIPSNASPSANPPSTITAGSSYTLTYTINLNDTFTNSTVCDEFRITASAGPTTDSATATACVSVGDPAFDVTSCDLPTNQVPQAPGILYSSDRKYAFPVAPYAGTTEGDSRDGLTCHHWDDNLSTDIFPAGVPLDWDQALKAPGIHAPLIAYTSGEIVYANPVIPEPIGGRNFILHGDDGRYYYYAHSCHVFVRKGQRVTAGQVIATTDRSGSAADTAEHLHFAINRNSGTFIGGDGDVCPSTDFNAKLEGYTRCELPSQQCP